MEAEVKRANCLAPHKVEEETKGPLANAVVFTLLCPLCSVVDGRVA